MGRSGASCYVYAKASGMLSKSFVGSKGMALFNARTLQELWGMLFKDEVPSVPQTMLAELIEKKATQKFISEFIHLLDFYSRPDEVSIELLRWFDFENLKEAAALLATGRSDSCKFNKITPYNLLKYEKWPDIKKMTEGTELSWYDKVPSVMEQQELSNKLDIQFIKAVWDAAQKLHSSERDVVQKVIADRYSMKNVIWVMRLKVYYNMTPEQIKNRLVYFDETERSKDDLFAGEALKIIDFKTDSYEDWANWKYLPLINEAEDSKLWKLNPQVVEERVSKRFYRLMKQSFHKYPFTAMVLVCWFCIKQNELDFIRTATEAIRLNVDQEQMLKIVNSL